MLCKLRCVNDHEFYEEELKMISAAYFYGVRGGCSGTYFAVCPYCGTDEYEEVYEEEEEEEEEKDYERD